MVEQGSTTGEEQHSVARKWWQTEKREKPSPVHQGQSCPKCYMADMDYDDLFRLRCPVCDYVAECGAFT